MGRILISGLLVYDSGKTWLGVSLARRLVSQGVSVGVFKPVAGHDAWRQYPTIVESFNRGILIGEDVVKYASVIGDTALEWMNPIDILLAPPDPLSYLGTNIYTYLNDLENQFRQIVLARVSFCSKNSTQHFIFRDNLKRVAPSIRRELELLTEKLGASEESLESFIRRLRDGGIEDELMECLRRVEEGRDIVIIESFNNAVTPFRRVLDTINALIVVAPGAVAVYYNNIGDVLKAVDEAAIRYGERGLESVHLLSRVSPSATLHLKPRMSTDEYDDSIEQLVNLLLSIR
ncbi:MAG: hypothetical protein RMI45_05595 [Ignisphaera sp.]|nr:hypothetical protein [Ignisphaera sp.]MDW8085695.1 hypothetical protein [Ignisphaera sp.]